MDNNKLIEQLNDIYYKHEWWHKNRLSEKELTKYHQYMIDNNRIIFYLNNDNIVSYIESWRLDYEQFGKIICNADFCVLDNNITNGPICYGANMFISNDYRNDSVTIMAMKNLFFKSNYDAKYFVWERRKKKTDMLKVFKRSDYIKDMEENNG